MFTYIKDLGINLSRSRDICTYIPEEAFESSSAVYDPFSILRDRG